MDLVSFVVQPTWKELLLELMSTEQMDPWDVDVGVVATKYLELVRNLEALDLRVPANVILASAILLRYKSENLSVEEPEESDTFEEAQLRDEALPDLVFRVNRPRKRRMTLDELMRSMEDVIRKGRKASGPKREGLPAILLHVGGQDMDQKMTAVYDKVVANQDAEGVVLFSDILEEKSAEQVAKHLLPVLHLVQERKINAWQDEFFGEIFMQVVNEEPLAEKEAA
ncbi:MAG: segregation/condensation protein A [Candidatus Micrarchaeota archaeon]|nr:segregation/condensation protein A [Candidatus Micrarchaeota archaeon]